MASHSSLFTSILLIFFLIAFAAAAEVVNLRLRTSTTTKKLSRPTVILISSDGFRFGYQFKAPNPNIRSLIADGTEAAEGLIPVFPSLSFPNHYSIVTGLYPPHHGIINNWFKDPFTNQTFTTKSHEPYWWLGEPLWETATRHGLNASALYWAGSEVIKDSWSCPPQFCPKYNSSVPFEDRIDTMLSFFDLPSSEIPAFNCLYLQEPDRQGDKYGPDDPRITDAIAHVDDMIGRLIDGLKDRGIYDEVTLILVGGHGMVATGETKRLFISDLSPWIEIPEDWVQTYYPLLGITPPADVSPADVVEKMNEALSSGEVENGEFLKMFLKEDLPERLHYSDSYRIPPVIGMLAESFMVEQERNKNCTYLGAHGYDNAVFSMRSIFVGRGPRFERGRKVKSFENVEIYNMVANILKLEGAHNDGDESFASYVLVPESGDGEYSRAAS